MTAIINGMVQLLLILSLFSHMNGQEGTGSGMYPPQWRPTVTEEGNFATGTLLTCFINATPALNPRVRWFVNGISLNNLPAPPESIRHNETTEDDGLVSNLPIPHIPYYNNSRFKCCIRRNNILICSNERTFIYYDGDTRIPNGPAVDKEQPYITRLELPVGIFVGVFLLLLLLLLCGVIVCVIYTCYKRHKAGTTIGEPKMNP